MVVEQGMKRANAATDSTVRQRAEAEMTVSYTTQWQKPKSAVLKMCFSHSSTTITLKYINCLLHNYLFIVFLFILKKGFNT